MPVETHIDRARERVRAERDAVDAKHDAYETFGGRVSKLQTDRTSPSATRTAGGVGSHHAVDGSGCDRCRPVRTAFAETVLPHSVADIDETESVVETIREEFGPEIAVALAPTTATSFTPELKQTVLAGVRSRRSEIAALQDALCREADVLTDAAETVDEVVDWLVDRDETPLTDLGFEALSRRHERLVAYGDRCDAVARRRQQFLRAATASGIDAGVRHQRLVVYLYQDFPVDYPVLSTISSLAETCRVCRRRVRAHLVRRV